MSLSITIMSHQNDLDVIQFSFLYNSEWNSQVDFGYSDEESKGEHLIHRLPGSLAVCLLYFVHVITIEEWVIIYWENKLPWKFAFLVKRRRRNIITYRRAGTHEGRCWMVDRQNVLDGLSLPVSLDPQQVAQILSVLMKCGTICHCCFLILTESFFSS